MRSDRTLTSLWQDTIEVKRSGKRPNTDTKGDVIIIGSGITAYTTALILQQEGKKCIVASTADIADTIPQTACLTTMPDVYSLYNNCMSDAANDLVAKSKREAIDLVEGLITKYNIDCDFTYDAGYLFAQTDDHVRVLQRTGTLSRELGMVAKETDLIPVPLPFAKAYRFDFQAQLHPLNYLLGLKEAFEKEGGIVLTHCDVATVADDDGDITATTTCGTVQAHAIVYADDSVHDKKTLALPVMPGCSYNAAFTLKKGAYPNGIVCDMDVPGHSFSTYTIDGQQYIVATGFEYNDCDEYSAAFGNLEAYLQKYFSVDKVTHRWVSHSCSGADGLPYSGKLPGKERIYTIACSGNNAIVYGSISAKIICGLIYNKPSDYENIYSPERVVDEEL